MTDPYHLPETELVEYDGYQIHLCQSGLEWLPFVARPKQRPGERWLNLLVTTARDPAIKLFCRLAEGGERACPGKG
jgi:hypothetical protein